MACGIYQILNVVTQKCYVGQSVGIKSRWKEHLKHLKGNAHHSIKLQRAWNKYGPDVWEWKIIKHCSKDQLTWQEAFYVASLDSLNGGYNCSTITLNGSDYKTSEEKRLKLSLANKGKCMKALLEKAILANTGKKRDPETIEKQKKTRASRVYAKRVTSEETRQKLIKAKLGKPLSKEHCLNVSKGLTGKSHTEERKANLRKTLATEEQRSRLAKPKSEEHKKNIGKANTGKVHTEETKAKIKEARAKQIMVPHAHSEETKRKISEAKKGKKPTTHPSANSHYFC